MFFVSMRALNNIKVSIEYDTIHSKRFNDQCYSSKLKWNCISIKKQSTNHWHFGCGAFLLVTKEDWHVCSVVSMFKCFETKISFVLLVYLSRTISSAFSSSNYSFVNLFICSTNFNRNVYKHFLMNLTFSLFDQFVNC